MEQTCGFEPGTSSQLDDAVTRLSRNNRSLFRQTATGLALLLFLSLLPSCAARHMPDWSRVQAVPPKTKTEAQLYKDKASKGSRKVKGPFRLGHDRLPHTEAQRRPNAHLGEAGRAQGAHPSPVLETMAGMGCLGGGPRSKSDVGTADWNLIRSPECSVLYSPHGPGGSFFPLVETGKDLRSSTPTPDATGRRSAVRC